MYQYRIIRSVSDLEKDLASWKNFLEQAQEKHFHQDPDKIVLQYRDREDRHPLRILIVTEDGRMRAIAPFAVQQQTFHLKLGIIKVLPVRVRLLTLLGRSVILHRDGEAGNVLPYVFRTLRAMVSEEKFDGIYLHDLPCGEALYTYLQSAPFRQLKLRGVNCDLYPDKDWIVPISGDFPGYLSSLGGNHRRKLNKYYTAIAGQSSCVRVERPEQVKDFLAGAGVIFKRSWQGRTFGENRKYADRAFLEKAAERGWLRSYLLRYRGEPVAFGTCFNYERKMYCEECGYDLRFSGVKPGYVLLYHIMEDLFRSGDADILDFGYGDNFYKHIFAREYYPAASVHVARTGCSFSFVLRCQVALRYLYLALHRIGELLRIEAFARSIIKRKTAILRVSTAQHP